MDAIFVDMHAEATAEKCAMGQYLDGRVSGMIGSHTHIPTADGRVLTKGTAYLTDGGMCGDYDSVIGFASDGAIKRFLTKNKKCRMETATGEATLWAHLIATDDKTGLAKDISTIKY